MQTCEEKRIKRNEYMRRYRATHPEHAAYMKTYCKQYRKLNRERIRERERKHKNQDAFGSPEYLNNLRLTTAKSWQDPDVRRARSEGIKKAWANPEIRKKQCASIKRAWITLRQDPEHMRKILARRTPSYYEERIIGLISKFNLPYQYVGDGQIWIGGKNPDFIHYDKKLTIEVYGTKQKREVVGTDNYEMDRSLHFATYGFSVIFLNEHDLFGDCWETRCLQKIAEYDECMLAKRQ